MENYDNDRVGLLLAVCFILAVATVLGLGMTFYPMITLMGLVFIGVICIIVLN